MLLVWLMICQACGIGHLLIMGRFVREVVYDTMSMHGHDWQVAHELFLVYLEFLETTPDSSINITNVYARGGMDLFMSRAVMNSQLHFRSRPSSMGGQYLQQVGDVKWNGAHNPKGKPCVCFNLERTHSAFFLQPGGGCKFSHVCDHWVTGKGKRGTCGGDHPRVKCTNPSKCDKAADA